MSRASGCVDGNWGVEVLRVRTGCEGTFVGGRREIEGVELKDTGCPRGVRRREDGVEGRNFDGATEDAEPSERCRSGVTGSAGEAQDADETGDTRGGARSKTKRCPWGDCS